MNDEIGTGVDPRLKELLTEGCKRLGLIPDSFELDEYEQVVAPLGRWMAVTEIDGGMVCDGDEGNLRAQVVGAPEHNNERVAFYFTPDEMDVGSECEPFEDIQPL